MEKSRLTIIPLVLCCLGSWSVVGCDDRDEDDSAGAGARPGEEDRSGKSGGLKGRLDDGSASGRGDDVPYGVKRELVAAVVRDPLSAIVNGMHERDGYGDSEVQYAMQILLRDKQYAAMASVVLELPEAGQRFLLAHFLMQWHRQEPAVAEAWVESLRDKDAELFKSTYPRIAREMVKKNLAPFRVAVFDESKEDWERELAGNVTAGRLTSLEGHEVALEFIAQIPKRFRAAARGEMLFYAFTDEESLPLIRELILSTPLDEAPSLDSVSNKIELATSTRVAMQFVDELRAADQTNPELAGAFAGPFNNWAMKDWEGAVEWLFASGNLTNEDRREMAEMAIGQAQGRPPGLKEYLPQLKEALGKRRFDWLTQNWDLGEEEP